MKGRVYWITGLPGSGKTTLGMALYYKLKETHDNVLILDGDILKEFVSDTVGYSPDDRIQRARKYSNICKILSDQGIWVVICTVAMFDEIRDWNRKNINGYIEIYLDVNREILERRNKKGLFSDANQSADWWLNYQLPKCPDVRLYSNQIDLDCVNDVVERVVQIAPQMESDYDRDTDYWNCVYSNQEIISNPSPFALKVLDDVISRGGGNLLDIGCGNGRDSLFFLQNGINVVGIDASVEAITKLNSLNLKNLGQFICDDFVRCLTVYQIMYDSIYSRFTLHAITEKQEDDLLKNVYSALKENGRFYLEARSINDDLFGKGTLNGKNSYIYDGHFRRFISIDELTDKMTRIGFKIISSEEGKGFSKTNDSDPVLIRIVAGI